MFWAPSPPLAFHVGGWLCPADSRTPALIILATAPAWPCGVGGAELSRRRGADTAADHLETGYTATKTDVGPPAGLRTIHQPV